VLGAGRTRVIVAPADQFRLLVAEQDAAGPELRALRVDNALVVTGLPEGRELELSNFFGACRPGRDCALEIGPAGAPPAVTLGNESAPIAALSDGSFLLLGSTTGLATLPAAVVPANEPGGPSPWLTGLVGLIGLGVAAGAAGGGGGGDEPTAVLGANATAPTPTPATTTTPSTTPSAPATPTPPPPPPATDTTAPTLSITDGTVAAVTNAPTTFTFRFSEAVSGFDASDVRVTGGTAGALVSAGDGRTWTMTVAPASGVAAGQIAVSVGAGAALDAAGNASATASATQDYDTLAPGQRLSLFRVTDDQPPNIGTLSNGGQTNDRTPIVTLTLDTVLGSGETLTLVRNGIAIRTLGAGNSLPPVDDSIPATGSFAYTATIADAAGNTTTLDLNGGATGTAFTIVVI
jgi:hypothetical protein